MKLLAFKGRHLIFPQRFLNMTARCVWGNRKSTSFRLDGAWNKKKQHKEREFFFSFPQLQCHSHKTISKPINHRCGMQRETKTKTWNGPWVAVSRCKEKTRQSFRLFSRGVFQGPSLFGEFEEAKGKKEHTRAAGNLFDCKPSITEVSNVPCGVRVKGHRFLVSLWIIIWAPEEKKTSVSFKSSFVSCLYTSALCCFSRDVVAIKSLQRSRRRLEQRCDMRKEIISVILTPLGP